MRRVYTEVASSYAPFNQAVLQGLGQAPVGVYASDNTDRSGWPKGRSYVGIAHFRAPYDEFGYFQDNTMQGLGHSNYVSVKGIGALAGIDPTEMIALDAQAPGAVKRFLLSGEPVSSLRSDVTLPFNQVHPYVYGAVALAALATSYLSYKRWKKTHGASSAT